MRKNQNINTIDQIITYAKQKGIIHLNTEDKSLHDAEINILGKKVTNFGSCSYLGLEFDPRLKLASKQAVEDYGTQFSSSRAYLSPRYYVELEKKLDHLFGAHTIVCPTTTLGHIATIPILVSPEDVVILDHQVHNSVQTAVGLVKAKGSKVEMVRHNRMDLLEDRIKQLRGQYKKIWYMADGIYSMFGDATPIEEIHILLDRYPEFHFYVDDAHAMSCFGQHGKGYVLGKMPLHEKMVVATSFAKAFATGGGVLVFSNKELAQKVRNCGGPLITSGPMQPSALGAAIASTDIHLSDEIYKLQHELRENIRYTTILLKKYGLPNLSASFSPIFFVGVGLPKVGYDLIDRLLKDGHYLNLGIFPAVPIKNTGVRFTITRLHTFKQIEDMVKSMAYHYPKALEEGGGSKKQVFKVFKLETPEEKEEGQIVNELTTHLSLSIDHKTTILDIDKEEWNELLGDRGMFDWESLNLLENSFSGNIFSEQNWDFQYIIIRDNLGKPILATFITIALSKDDMFSPVEISVEVEEIRKNDPFYLTSRTLTVGSYLTEGDHLYIDRSSELWKNAMRVLFHKIVELQEKFKTTTTCIRDLGMDDPEMDGFMVDNGFFKIEMPENHKINDVDWTNEDELYRTLSKRSKRHFRENILKNKDKFEVTIHKELDDSEIHLFYKLYQKVKTHSLFLNTFELPYKLFKLIASNDSFEVISLTLKPEYDFRDERLPVSVMLTHKGQTEYSGIIIGIDYDFNKKYCVYRNAINILLKRAARLGYKEIGLGFSASTEKKKFGATPLRTCAYMQVDDNYNMAALNTISSKTSTAGNQLIKS